MDNSDTDKSNKMTHTRQKGRVGEDIATAFLEREGFQIIERNWYYRHKEVDIIAIDGDELVIIEVKSRTAPMLERPEQAIDRNKQRLLVYAANAYARYNRILKEIRFDVVFVIDSAEGREIRHIRRAFYPLL